jgi:hypothetical protein
MRYYDVPRKGGRIEPHLADEGLNAVLARDFDKFTFGRWGRPFARGQCPATSRAATGTRATGAPSPSSGVAPARTGGRVLAPGRRLRVYRAPPITQG